MKLVIKKDQAKKLMGKISFELQAKVELTNEERSLVSKYKVGKEILMKKTVKARFTGSVYNLCITIDSLMAGQIFKCNDILEILEYGKNIRESCECFKNYIEVMGLFGGEEIIEI